MGRESVYIRLVRETGIMNINLGGLIVAVATLLAIAFGHVFVRRMYGWFGKKIWPVSLLAGMFLIASSLLAGETVVSASAAVWGAMFLWAIKEFFEMGERGRE